MQNMYIRDSHVYKSLMGRLFWVLFLSATQCNVFDEEKQQNVCDIKSNFTYCNSMRQGDLIYCFCLDSGYHYVDPMPYYYLHAAHGLNVFHKNGDTVFVVMREMPFSNMITIDASELKESYISNNKYIKNYELLNFNHEKKEDYFELNFTEKMHDDFYMVTSLLDTCIGAEFSIKYETKKIEKSNKNAFEQLCKSFRYTYEKKH